MQDNPQIILICCEGKVTEKLYFEIIQNTFRVANISIHIFPKAGQHYHLIDKSFDTKREFAEEFGFELDDIEVWAVCDRDNLKDSFTKLKDYAEQHGVDLAFSDPQFENYLLQHFGSPNNCHKRGFELEQELTATLLNHGVGVAYDKSNLRWLAVMIDQKPRLVEEAIRHADAYSVHSKQPFFTIQRLIERILSFRA
ncbi:MAG: RloB family protein [Clostridiales Family XIII bacterium]|jgi:hypothetical protein|nr:RloB family protein [Clostridiales Family XIII bacterium]